MTRLVQAELLKLRTTRTSKVFVAVAIVLTVLLVAATLAARGELGVVSEEEKLRILLSRSANAALFLLVLGVVGAAGEYRHDTASSTFLVTPDRRRAVLGQALAHAGLGAAVGALSAALTAALVVPVVSSDAGKLALSVGEIVLLLVGCAIGCALWPALGVGLGALMGHQAWAVAAALVYLLVIEQLVIGIAPDVGHYTIQGATTSLTGAPPLESPPGWVGGLVLLAWTAAVVALGLARSAVRDVT